MRFIKLVLLAIILIGIVLVAVANRTMMTFNLLPAQLAELAANFNIPTEFTLPTFAVLLLAVGMGLLLGYILEWLRERKHRKAVGQSKRELSRLESEIAAIRKKTGEGEDDVLALLN